MDDQLHEYEEFTKVNRNFSSNICRKMKLMMYFAGDMLPWQSFLCGSTCCYKVTNCYTQNKPVGKKKKMFPSIFKSVYTIHLTQLEIQLVSAVSSLVHWKGKNQYHKNSPNTERRAEKSISTLKSITEWNLQSDPLKSILTENCLNTASSNTTTTTWHLLIGLLMFSIFKTKAWEELIPPLPTGCFLFSPVTRIKTQTLTLRLSASTDVRVAIGMRNMHLGNGQAK